MTAPRTERFSPAGDAASPASDTPASNKVTNHRKGVMRHLLSGSPHLGAPRRQPQDQHRHVVLAAIAADERDDVRQHAVAQPLDAPSRVAPQALLEALEAKEVVAP